MRYLFTALLFNLFIINTFANSEKEVFYSGFFYAEWDDQGDKTAFVNLIFKNNDLVIELDFFNLYGKRAKKTLIYRKARDLNTSPFKTIQTFEYKDGAKAFIDGRKYSDDLVFLNFRLQLEFTNNASEIHGNFNTDLSNYFYCIKTDKKMKCSKGDVLFTGDIIQNQPLGEGFFIWKDENGIMSNCLYSNFTNLNDYNGLTIFIEKTTLMKGYSEKGKFANHYTMENGWTGCYFEDYDHVPVKWEVVLDDHKDIKKGAYGINCSGKLAKKCDTNFENCQQLIQKKEDYSLLYALGSLATIVAGGISAISSVSNEIYPSSSTSSISESSTLESKNGSNCITESIALESKSTRCNLKFPDFKIKCGNGDTKFYYFVENNIKDCGLLGFSGKGFYRPMKLGDDFLGENYEKAMKKLCNCSN